VKASTKFRLPMSDVERQRLCQERRARGAVVIQRLVLSPAAIDGLINLGWLPATDRGDRE
jgi:hypothetical protein